MGDVQYTRFDRHENMSLQTRDTLMELTYVPDMIVRNQIYGLLDGYLYADLYERFMNMEYTSLYTEEHKEAFKKVYEEIVNYPTLSKA